MPRRVWQPVSLFTAVLNPCFVWNKILLLCTKTYLPYHCHLVTNIIPFFSPQQTVWKKLLCYHMRVRCMGSANLKSQHISNDLKRHGLNNKKHWGRCSVSESTISPNSQIWTTFGYFSLCVQAILQKGFRKHPIIT